MRAKAPRIAFDLNRDASLAGMVAKIPYRACVCGVGMAKVYGGRWEIIQTLKSGGQADVFRVRDRTALEVGDFALKRVKNPARHERFRAEIEAIKRLEHPNIVRLIDHSALDGGAEERQFLVMPLAQGGDLSDEKRAATFKGAIDATVRVALQLADGLAAAHAAGVIHRDVKPANILFQDVGYDVWLADFGICLLREKPRTTQDKEVVGPRDGFMAPECEDGGQLEVTPAADIYSLGKIIYYMLSGGRALPREKLDDPGYALGLGDGTRIQLVQVLLRRMICPIERRIRDTSEVISELKRIEAWVAPGATPLGERGRALLGAHAAHVSHAEHIHAENQAARSAEQQSQTRIKAGFDAWLSNELELAAREMRVGGAICEVAPDDSFGERIRSGGNTQYRPMGGWRLAYASSARDGNRRSVLRMLLCLEFTPTSSVREGSAPTLPTTQTEREMHFAMIPYYNLAIDITGPVWSDVQGFLSKRSKIGSVQTLLPAMSVGRPVVQQLRIRRLMGTFFQDIGYCSKFSASEWPGAMEGLRSALGDMLETFIEEIHTPSLIVGL